jgi:hypothetical protein
MGPTLPLDKMTVAEKLLAMECLWDDLSCNAQEAPSPTWHADVLAKRERQVAEGNMSFIGLDEAKERIREATHGTDRHTLPFDV